MTGIHDQQIALTGGCLCGALRYEVSGRPKAAVHCYCNDCRRSSGSGHCTHVICAEADFTLHGTPASYERRADSGTLVRRHFCPACAAPLFSTGDGGSGLVFLRAASFDDPNVVTPQASVYASRAPKWDPVDPALPAFPEMPSQEQQQAMLEQG